MASCYPGEVRSLAQTGDHSLPADPGVGGDAGLAFGHGGGHRRLGQQLVRDLPRCPPGIAGADRSTGAVAVDEIFADEAVLTGGHGDLSRALVIPASLLHWQQRAAVGTGHSLRAIMDSTQHRCRKTALDPNLTKRRLRSGHRILRPSAVRVVPDV